jgi:2,3-bisphosphoglycerate-dependent phosphoglycerate mutase
MEMTEIILVRHGETVWNEQGRMQGHHDSPLTEVGLRQARLVARRLKAVEFAALYSSDLGRAHQTARYIADDTGHDIRMDARLRERCFGVFEGLTRAEIECRHPADYGMFASRDPAWVVPGGESAVAFRDRCVGCLAEIATSHQGVVVVVSHGLVLDMLYRAATRLALDQPRGFQLLNCSINRFQHSDDGWKALALCDVDHLADEPVAVRAAGGRGW